jgi:ABC-type antimicrobial peptide transport system permease subunit
MDPKDDFLEYRIFPNKWQNTNVLQYQLKRDDVGKEITFQIGIRSKRKYHAYPMGYDDRITIAYTVLPAD